MHSVLSYIPGLGHEAKKTGLDSVVKCWFNSRHHLSLRFSAEKSNYLNKKDLPNEIVIFLMAL